MWTEEAIAIDIFYKQQRSPIRQHSAIVHNLD
jgi:hypothetical protein